MTYLIIRHAVADFEKWKPHYDAHAAARDAAGLTEVDILHDLGDPNFLVLVFEMSDVEKTKALLESTSIREAMTAGGVMGKPEFHLLQTRQP